MPHVDPQELDRAIEAIRAMPDALRKLSDYIDAFQTLVPWKRGDVAVLAKDLHRGTGAWGGLPYLAKGSVGTVQSVEWDRTRKKVRVDWCPLIEPNGSLRAMQSHSKQPPGSVRRLYLDILGPRISEEERGQIQKRIDAYLSRGWYPYCVNEPDDVHSYALFLEDIEKPSTFTVWSRLEGRDPLEEVPVECARCGLTTPYAKLDVLVYEPKTGRRPIRPGEQASIRYRQCPACGESKALLLPDPPFPVDNPNL